MESLVLYHLDIEGLEWIGSIGILILLIIVLKLAISRKLPYQPLYFFGIFERFRPRSIQICQKSIGVGKEVFEI